MGGGFMGSLSAALLGQLGLKVKVLEKASQSEFLGLEDLRSIAITRRSRAILEGLGDGAILALHAQPIYKIVVQHAGHPDLEMESPDEKQPLAHMVPANSLKNQLYTQATGCPSVSWKFDAPMETMDISSPYGCVYLQDASYLKASLIVAADGARSWVREKLSLSSLPIDYHQVALLNTYSFREGPAHTAFEKFLKGSTLAVLPSSPYTLSTVWMVSPEEGDRLMALSLADFTRALSPFLSEFSGLSPASSTRRAKVRGEWVPRFVTSRAALVGDAAHLLHPLAGLGLNLGIQDIAVLKEEVQKGLSLGLDIGSLAILEPYQNRRRLEHAKILGFTDTLHRLFEPSSGLSFLKDYALRYAHSSSVLKEVFLSDLI